MSVIDGDSAAVTYHDVGGVELSDLVHNEVFHDELDKKALEHLDVLFPTFLEALRETILQPLISNGKYVDILVEVLSCPITMMSIHLLNELVIILRVVI